MSAVVAGVKAKLMLRLPGQIGTNRQWSDAYVESLILMAAHYACEMIGYQRVSQTISLVNNQHEYALSSTFVQVSSVEHSTDGTNFTQPMRPVTLGALDDLSSSWRDDRNSLPTRYALISTPGLQDPVSAITAGGATILIYPPPAAAGSAKIRVGGAGIGSATTSVPEGVQERVHVPYVMAMLRAQNNVEEAAGYYQQFKDECDKLRGRFINQYPGGTTEGGAY